MKLNLGCGTDIRTGYVNIDRLPSPALPTGVDYKQGDIQSLDWITEDNTVDEIIAADCIEYLPPDIIQQTLSNWGRKLITGGVLKILIPDGHVVANAFVQGQFSLQEYSKITFGTQADNDRRMSILDASTLLSMIKEAGLSILLKRYEGVAIYVEAAK
jgi:predicted SAM-dependent methyltransferase